MDEMGSGRQDRANDQEPSQELDVQLSIHGLVDLYPWGVRSPMPRISRGEGDPKSVREFRVVSNTRASNGLVYGFVSLPQRWREYAQTKTIPQSFDVHERKCCS
jgi:hypothetical protein